MTMFNSKDKNAPMGRGELCFLMLTAFLCGSLIMVIEVLGSRVVGPFFGVSLFVWSSLIAVAMIALAAGYAVGGRLADRFDHPDGLYALIAGAGCLVVLIPLVKGVVLTMCLPLGLRLGAFVSSLLLFGPSLLLLGCVSPYLVKVAAREVSNLGRTVGSLYAVSTVGSVVGTVATGFLLIIYLGVNEVFFLVGSLLICLSLAYFVVARKRFVMLLLLFVPFGGYLLQAAGTTTVVLPSGTTATVVDEVESSYGNIKVVDYRYGTRHNREMVLDGVIQSGVDMLNGLSVYPYYYLLGIVPYTINPDGSDCLVIGAGGGTIPHWYESKGVRTDVVDIDPKIFEVARRYFNFQVTGEVHVGDARYFLATHDKKYDYIVMDVFSGEAAPPHIISIEALSVLKSRLKEKGVLAINFMGRLSGDTFMTASVERTLGEVFDQIDLYSNFDQTQGDGIGNISIIAYDGNEVTLPKDVVSRFRIHPSTLEEVTLALSRKAHLQEDARGVVLSDNYNPIDCYDFEVREHMRRGVLETTPLEILVN